ncbi:hypothetical protein CRUP_023564 [Coryphaenoides rupestris]|nr:hypothetical protein CRUP_023564 [Coryphaenoides rupestris]
MGDEDKLYKAEYAKSGRASCKKSPMFDGKVPHWHHFSCFWQRAAAQSTADVAGFSDLRWEDQEKVKKAIESGGATGGKADQKGGAKGEKTLNDFAVEYAKSNRSTCKGCEEKIEKDQIRVSKKSVDAEKPQLGLIDRWYHTACFVSRREDLLFKSEYSAAQLKGFNALKAEDKEDLKKRLPAVQSQLIWGIKDKLKKNCSTNDMKELLIANSQDVPSGESNVLDCLADGMVFGALQSCAECEGQLVFKGDAYYCTGDISAWTKCVFNTKMPVRKDWIIPKEFHEIPFLKKFKSKRQDRIYPKVEPTPTPAVASSASSGSTKPLPEGTPAGKPLTGMKLLAVGKLKKNKEEIKASELEKMSKKMEEVKEAGVRVVAEEFLADVMAASGKSLQELVSVHAISPWGAEVKVEAKASAVPSKYWVFRSWGRVGTTIGGNKLDKFQDKLSAMDNFLGVYKEKTGNTWNCTNFTKYPNKFYPLEIDYGQDEDAVKRLTESAGTRSELAKPYPNKFYPLEIDYGQDEDAVKRLTESAGTRSELAKPVQELIRMIFDVESMKKAMVEFEIDLQKMPLGKLSKRQIQSAYALLSEVQQAVSDSVAESQILDLSNRFYTLIPHDFGMKKPPLLSNLDYSKVQMLDNLLDIEVAYSLLRGGAEDNGKDPIDLNYEKLKTKIEVVDKNSSEAEIILQYIFKIVREGEYQRFRPFKDLHNRQLLWHGSRTTNYAGILSQGLRIAPPEAPVTGYMFGKGVYFADMVSKSANYCHTSQSDPVGLLLLGEVALGNMHELKKAAHITKIPKGKHSVKGVGRTAPDPGATATLDGVQVPLGKGSNTNIDDTSLLYNEYIVYDVAQVNLKYLLKTKFNYQTSLW